MNRFLKTIRSDQRLFALLAFALMSAFALAACQAETPPAPTPAPTPEPPPTEAPPTEAPTVDLEEVYANLWVLVAFGDPANPTIVERGTVVTIEFSEDGSVSGSGGCNNYFGSMEIAPDGTITVVSPFGSTMMACERGMEQEAAYLAALGMAQRLSLTPQGRLEVFYDNSAGGEDVIVYAKGETPLVGTQWILMGYGDPNAPTSVQPGTTISAVFDEENVGGSAGCNSYSGSYSIDGDQITFGPLISTMMFCEGLMDQETAYLEALGKAETFQIFGRRLTITYDGGQGALVYTSESLPLEFTLWRLVAINGIALPEEVEVTALFAPGDEPDSGSVAGSAGCNNYNAGYTLDGDSISIGPIAATRKFCETGMDEEQAYLVTLEGAQTYTILGDTLEIVSGGGILTYTAERTPLQGALWVLAGIGDPDDPQPPVEGANFTAQFTRNLDAPTGVVAGTTGCNEYSAAYAASLDEIKINPPQATDNQGCSPALNLQEEQYFAALNAATTYQITGNLLVVSYGDEGLVLLFMGTQLEAVGRLPLTDLDGTTWYLHLINSQPTTPGTEITAQFSVDPGGESGLFNGSAGCNAYVSSFGLDLGVVATLTSTKACTTPPGVMEQEQAYINALNRAYGYWLTGQQLVVNTGLGALTYRTSPPDAAGDQTHLLQGVTWFLVSYGDKGSVPATTEPNVFFDANGSLKGNTGCNTISGQYTTALNQLSISQLQVGSGACPDEAANEQQGAMVAGLNTARTYQVADNQMQIVADSGVLNFSKVPVTRPDPVEPPTAVIEAPAQVQVGEAAPFDGSKSTAETEITSYEWDFGDGQTASGASVRHAYSAAGSFDVQLTVKDELGNTGITIHDITVVEAPPEQVPPTAAIQGPSQGFVAEPVTFSAAGSTQGSSPIVSYAWDFGNGSNLPAGSNPQVTTLYDQPGSYTVVVTVTDENGLNSNASMQIVVGTRLEGPVWVLDPQQFSLVPGTSITLQFLQGTLVGFSGCNTYNGSYTASQTPDGSYTVTISPLTTTQLACPQNIMEQEQQYLGQFQATRGALIQGNILSLLTAETTLVYYELGTPNP